MILVAPLTLWLFGFVIFLQEGRPIDAYGRDLVTLLKLVIPMELVRTEGAALYDEQLIYVLVCLLRRAFCVR